LAFDVHGLVRRFDLRRLPQSLKAPAAATDINADYHVAGTPENVKGDLKFAPSTVAGAHIAQASTVSFGLQGKDVSYSADATVSDLDLERVGEQFKVPALATERYRSTINAHVTANGAGTDPKAMRVTAAGAI